VKRRTDKVLVPQELNERAKRAKTDPTEMDSLIHDFAPFLMSRAAKYTIKFDNYQKEELFSTAQVAFYEAIKIYDENKGHFFPFAGNVVRNKLIDHIRRLYRPEVKTVTLDADDNDDKTTVKAVDSVSFDKFVINTQNEAVVEELNRFVEELANWKISLDSLVKNSPKHSKVKILYKDLVRRVLREPEIMQVIKVKRYFPVKSVAMLTGLPQKKLERARTYILASLIIKMGDYDYLSEYVDGGE